MTMSISTIKESKDRLEKDMEELLYRFEKTTGFIVTGVKMTRYLIKNANFPKDVLYNTEISMSL